MTHLSPVVQLGVHMPRLGVLEHRSQGSASWDPGDTVVWAAAPKRPVSHSAPIGVNRLERCCPAPGSLPRVPACGPPTAPWFHLQQGEGAQDGTSGVAPAFLTR